MSIALKLQDDWEILYARLKSQAMATPNHEWLVCMVSSWCLGKSALPDYLGLEPVQFNGLVGHYFPGCRIPELAPSGIRPDFSRMLERDDLVNLLKHYSQSDGFESNCIIGIIVAGCLGNDHLWQDLGLLNRTQLSDMLRYNFPELAAKNDKDMKWKKFLYKQLCEAEGLYLCRAPSCAVCSDYPKCYGPEN
ncbi:nitrogen fixation protein NifQ [Methylobacter sp. Wu1]|uniref:nitrogen fixation protein NifQ n=1 Tax=Methylobacter sp. Wu1 TaxID=3119359 RepID=UPI002F93AEF7